MKCEICGNDIGDTTVILPIKKQDGCLNSLACLNCAEKSSAYCRKHNRPHLGFADDDTTACMFCIEELVVEKRPEELHIFDMITQVLPSEELEDLLEWTDLAGAITGDSQATCVLRAIATKALRRKGSIEKIVEEILQTKSVGIILPRGFI